jgi:hypothetical protein
MQVTIKGIEQEFARMSGEIKKKCNDAVKIASIAMETELVLATPVDTGRARKGWDLQFEKDKAVLNNDVPYIGDLNNGHSKQAPSHYIENIAIQYGKPLGAIITVKS